MDPLILGLDLGTTNAKAAAYTLTGAAVASATETYPTRFPRPGWAEQRPRDWIAALTAATQQVMAQLGDRKRALVAVGLSAHGPGVVLVDEAGDPVLATSPTWQDTRCLAQGERLIEQVGLGWAGQGLPENSFPPKLCWIIEHHRAVASQARYALGIKDFLVHWLTGEVATEPTTTAGADIWWTPVFDACGWPLEKLPMIVPATTVIGPVLPKVADALGLPPALPVVMGINDGAAATLSMGALRPGDVVVTLATAGSIRVVIEKPVEPQVRLQHNLFYWPYVAGQWIVGGQLKAAASALDWFARGYMGLVTVAQLLAEAEQSPPGSRGVLFIPYLMGRGSPLPDANATGAFLGLTMQSGRGDQARAILEGVAYELRTLLDTLLALGHPCTELRMSGGGARSPLWREILAAVLARPIPHYTADSTLGAAIMAAVGGGYQESLDTAVAQMVRCDGVTLVPSEQVEEYVKTYQMYVRWREQLFP
ncbi:MAG: FGGY family carbohydrate kinase [Caldilineaceae bacterium]